MLKNNLKNILEAIIFASDNPASIEKMNEVLVSEGYERRDIVQALSELKEEYFLRSGGIILEEVAGGYQFRTRAEFAPWVRKFKAARPFSLSPAALETLAVIAYRQPVIKMEIDKLRGVDSGGVLRHLMEKKLVRIVGRKDVPGRPFLYGTTKRFLEIFNLKDISELPTVKELKDLEKKD